MTHPKPRAKGRAQPKWRAYFQEGTVWNDTTIFQDSWTINADQLDAMAERMARAIAKEGGFPASKYGYAFKGEARAALKSIGITAPRKERKRP